METFVTFIIKCTYKNYKLVLTFKTNNMKKLFILLSIIAVVTIMGCEKPEIHDYVCTQTETMDVNVGFTWGDKEINILYQTNNDMRTFEEMNTYDEYKQINGQQILVHLKTTCKILK